MALFLAALYNAFPASMLISVGLFRFTWLEMQINMGWIFFALWGLFTLILLKWNRFFVRCLNVRRVLANLFVCGIGCLALLGIRRLAIVPASIIREGLLLPRLPFVYINMCISVFLLLGCLALYLQKIQKNGNNVDSHSI
jgi:hypothetical protein